MKVFRDNWLEKRRNYQSANVVLDPENSPPAVLPRPQVASALDLTSFEMETESNPLAGPLPSSGEFDNPVFKPGQRVNAGAHTPRPPRMIRGPTREWSQQPQLTQEEYEAQRTDDIVGNLFRAVDADGNGSLTPAELMKWWSVQCHFEKTVTHKSWLRMQKLLEGVGYHDLYIGRLNQTWLRQRLQDMINDEWTPMTDETGRNGFQSQDSGVVLPTRPSIVSWAAENLPSNLARPTTNRQTNQMRCIAPTMMLHQCNS